MKKFSYFLYVIIVSASLGFNVIGTPVKADADPQYIFLPQQATTAVENTAREYVPVPYEVPVEKIIYRTVVEKMEDQTPRISNATMDKIAPLKIAPINGH